DCSHGSGSTRGVARRYLAAHVRGGIMARSEPPLIRFAASWSTQLRLTQAVGRGLSSLMPIRAQIVIGTGAGSGGLANDEFDLIFLKSVNNEHQYTGKGLYAGSSPASWLRTIAWLPQEDRFLYAVAPWTGIERFEDFVEKKPALNVAGRASAQLLKE